MSADERPDLDQELRRLFSDDRLSVPVAENAAGVVVAGARRRRRHRMAMAAAGGVLAVTGLVFAGVGLTGIGHQNGAVTAASPVLSATLTATSPPPTTSAAQTGDVLGPYGADGLRLGMSDVEARKLGVPLKSGEVMTERCQTATVMVPGVPPALSATPTGAPGAALRTTTATTEAPTSAVTGPLATGQGARVYRVTVVTSAGSDVVVQLGGATALRTPEGLGVGSSIKSIMQVYRTVERPYNGKELAVVVPQNPAADYVFVLDRSGTAIMVWLVMAKYLACVS